MTRDRGDNGGRWGDHHLGDGETIRWRIGPLELAVHRGRQEWQLAWGWDPERSKSQRWELEAGTELPEEPQHHERFVVGETGDRVGVRPALADRPVVSLPRLPVHLLPECEATLYVGSPVWVVVEVGEPAVTLCELPSLRPSDIWFGDSTREGELCYSTQTRARLQSENLPVFSRSAITAVLIRNLASSPLELDRLKLPVPLLSLYCGERGRLWTEPVTLTRNEESQMASLDIGEAAPPEAGEARLLSPAREAADSSPWIRAFSMLGFGRREE